MHVRESERETETEREREREREKKTSVCSTHMYIDECVWVCE